MSLSCISHLIGHFILNDYVIALLKRDIDKYHETASSLDDDACLEDEIQESLTSNIIF
ncbi:MAG TPA: hypothetical protein VI033_09085 [Candidatus Nitrosopolaris sp.]|jgi:hypothetical protein